MGRFGPSFPLIRALGVAQTRTASAEMGHFGPSSPSPQNKKRTAGPFPRSRGAPLLFFHFFFGLLCDADVTTLGLLWLFELAAMAGMATEKLIRSAQATDAVFKANLFIEFILLFPKFGNSIPQNKPKLTAKVVSLKQQISELHRTLHRPQARAIYWSTPRRAPQWTGEPSRNQRRLHASA